MLDAWGWIGKGELGNYSCNFHWEFTSFPQSKLGALGTSAKELIAGLNPLLRAWRGITNAPSSADSSIDSTTGSDAGSGRIAASIGVTQAGHSCL